MTTKKENIEKIRIILQEMHDSKQIDFDRYKSIWGTLERLERWKMVKRLDEKWIRGRPPLRECGVGEITEKGNYWLCEVCGQRWKDKKSAKFCRHPSGKPVATTKKCPSDLEDYECPKCKSKKWFKNPTTEMMFCRYCGYVIGDLKND